MVGSPHTCGEPIYMVAWLALVGGQVGGPGGRIQIPPWIAWYPENRSIYLDIWVLLINVIWWITAEGKFRFGVDSSRI